MAFAGAAIHGNARRAVARNKAAAARERQIERHRGSAAATRGGAKSDIMRALRSTEDAREAWLNSPERAVGVWDIPAQRQERREGGQASLQSSCSPHLAAKRSPHPAPHRYRSSP